MKKIGVTGASGLIGAAVRKHLDASGVETYAFVRRKATKPNEIEWSPSAGVLNPSDLAGLDAVIHLAGEPVFGRWTDAKKTRILQSRVLGTQLIANALAALDHPCALVSCSAIGCYGSSLTDTFTEADGVGSGFLADVCRQWEAATKPAQQAGQRVVIPRIGLVLSPEAGALKQMLLPFKSGLGGVVASGEQWMSWVSLRDAVQIIALCASDESLSGPVNCVGPSPVTNRVFTKALAQVLNRPAVIPIPSFGLRMLYGSMADETVLASQKVMPDVLHSIDYEFLDTEIEETLARLLN